MTTMYRCFGVDNRESAGHGKGGPHEADSRPLVRSGRWTAKVGQPVILIVLSEIFMAIAAASTCGRREQALATAADVLDDVIRVRVPAGAGW
jgi:hypothetical protein